MGYRYEFSRKCPNCGHLIKCYFADSSGIKVVLCSNCKTRYELVLDFKLIKKASTILITQSNAISVCCKAKIKMNPIEWESPYYVKSWEFWCLKCQKKCEAEKIKGR